MQVMGGAVEALQGAWKPKRGKCSLVPKWIEVQTLKRPMFISVRGPYGKWTHRYASQYSWFQTHTSAGELE
jgi:hypothetical protein